MRARFKWLALSILLPGAVAAQPVIHFVRVHPTYLYTIPIDELGVNVTRAIITIDGVDQEACGASCIIAAVVTWDVTAMIERGAVFVIHARGCTALGACGAASPTITVDPRPPASPESLRLLLGQK